MTTNNTFEEQQVRQLLLTKMHDKKQEAMKKWLEGNGAEMPIMRLVLDDFSVEDGVGVLRHVYQVAAIREDSGAWEVLVATVELAATGIIDIEDPKPHVYVDMGGNRVAMRVKSEANAHMVRDCLIGVDWA